MRQRNFWIGALVALLTFTTLTAFLGRRHHGWHRGWRHEQCYDHHHRRNGDKDSKQPQPSDENDSKDKMEE